MPGDQTVPQTPVRQSSSVPVSDTVFHMDDITIFGFLRPVAGVPLLLSSIRNPASVCLCDHKWSPVCFVACVRWSGIFCGYGLSYCSLWQKMTKQKPPISYVSVLHQCDSLLCNSQLCMVSTVGALPLGHQPRILRIQVLQVSTFCFLYSISYFINIYSRWNCRYCSYITLFTKCRPHCQEPPCEEELCCQLTSQRWRNSDSFVLLVIADAATKDDVDKVRQVIVSSFRCSGNQQYLYSQRKSQYL
jgi:hypothetical protein